MEEYLTRRRKAIDADYDYRYSQLPLVFGQLVSKGRIRVEDLQGLDEEKLAFVRFMTKDRSRIFPNGGGTCLPVVTSWVSMKHWFRGSQPLPVCRGVSKARPGNPSRFSCGCGWEGRFRYGLAGLSSASDFQIERPKKLIWAEFENVVLTQGRLGLTQDLVP
jgi:hypothetical protein